MKEQDKKDDGTKGANSKYYEFAKLRKRERQIEKRIKEKKQRHRVHRRKEEEEEDEDTKKTRIESSLEEVVRANRRITKRDQRKTKTRAFMPSDDSDSSSVQNSSSSSDFDAMETEEKPKGTQSGVINPFGVSEIENGAETIPATIAMGMGQTIDQENQ